MSEMKPLLDESVSPDAARLLRSADIDGPASPESERARTLAALGLLPSDALGAPSSPTGRGLASFTRAGMLSAVAAVVVFGTFGTFVAVRSSSSTPAPASSSGGDAPSVAVAASAIPPAPSASEGVRVDELPTVETEGMTAAEDGARKNVAPRPSSATKAPRRPGLEDELSAIDAARGALASGKPDVALAHVKGYQRTFREGRFAEEAEALEIQALAALGRRDEARESGARFLASHPGSPYARRVRSAIGSEEVKP